MPDLGGFKRGGIQKPGDAHLMLEGLQERVRLPPRVV